ncbi:zinc finger protein 354C isoform X1 [Silurus meridionalis]|nr:zinc finger protein 354C isoform X1 [Silurus meridionalis]
MSKAASFFIFFLLYYNISYYISVIRRVACPTSSFCCWCKVNPELKMTQMDVLVTNVAELLATAVHEVLRLMGQAVSEYRDESSRIRQENQKLQRTLEELQMRLRITDAAQQVSSSVAAEEPLYESHHGQVSDREQAVMEENVERDSYELSFEEEEEEEKPSALHLRAETRQANEEVPSPCDFSHKRTRSLSSSRSRSASPDVRGVPGIPNHIKTESKSEFPECSLLEQRENTILHLPCYPAHANPAHVSWDPSGPPDECVRAENATDGVGPFGVTTRRESSHTCHVCGKSFATASSLGAHFVCHSGERPFACERCQFRFSRLADLKKHERIHTGEKPYNCMLCGRRFNRTENLRRHLKKVHRGALLY